VNPLIELEELAGLFHDPNSNPLYTAAEHIAREATPEPYHRMLVHELHMTVTMEAYYDCPVDVVVLQTRDEDGLYLRQSLLKKQGTEDVIQYGIVRFNLNYVTAPVRDEILSETIPLGRILIQHNVLRHIDLGAIIRLTAGSGLSCYLPMNEGDVTYGRMATIFCNGAPAVDLLEISAPLN
jgi:hypothetical protein